MGPQIALMWAGVVERALAIFSKLWNTIRRRKDKKDDPTSPTT